MEKYGVEIPEEQTKHASKGECPGCGGKLDMSANPPRCPKCGFEPQEQRREG